MAGIKRLETSRLTLHEFDLDEAPWHKNLNVNPDVMRYTGDVPFESVEETRAFLNAYKQYELHGYGRWSVYLKHTGAWIGWCGLKNHPEEGYVDLGYRLLEEHWNNGYATEACLGCIEYGFETLGLSEIVGRVAAENGASIRVLEKCGMQFWKNAPCEGIDDSLYYRIRR